MQFYCVLWGRLSGCFGIPRGCEAVCVHDNRCPMSAAIAPPVTRSPAQVSVSPSAAVLWPGMHFLERGWLSANHVVFTQGRVAVVDTGYCSQAAQTVALLRHTLAERPLELVVNTHLHSDHCGGNAAVQATWPQARTLVAPGQVAHVHDWNPDALSYTPTGQDCPRFRADGVLQPGETVLLGEHEWQVHAAPGHDPHALLLFEPQRRLLISADALWERGFGVVFPEIEGEDAFDAVAATLDVIERLQPACVLPGHGAMFHDVAGALAVARRRLVDFAANPQRHAHYAAKVLLKYKMLEWQQASLHHVQDWCAATPYMQLLRVRYFAPMDNPSWVQHLAQELVASQALQSEGEMLINL